MGKLWDQMMGDGWENDGRSEGRVLFKKRIKPGPESMDIFHGIV